ncbi:MAG: hypothetical protein IH906_04770 [Proteobacteria bacterium]|nr:hypothetical protein [Pseudomonadota bacterium]
MDLTDVELGDWGGAEVSPDQLRFTAMNGETLPSEVVDFNLAAGRLRAWVRIPRLSSSSDTEILLTFDSPGEDTGAPVWDGDGHTIVHVAEPATPHRCIPQEETADLGEALTVEAWVEGSCRAEATQAVVSRWASRVSFDAFSGHDAANTDGLDTVGYFGAVFDGRHVYWCPIRSGPDRDSVHGRVLRYDTHGDFRDPASYEAFDASYTDGLHTSGFYGGAFDGRYVIFNPRDDGGNHHSRFLRYDTHADFKDPASWDAFDAGLPNSGQGVAFDGRYLYRCPGYGDSGDTFNDNVESGAVLRFDTRSALDDPDSYRVFDARQLSDDAVCFDGGAFDGRHVYFVPLSRGVVLRLDTAGDFGDPGSWETYDAKRLGMTSNVGAVFDGRFIYFAAYSSTAMVRYDTRGPFADDASWEVRDAANTGGLETGGFDGGFFDGRYVYYVPFTRRVPEDSDESHFHCNYLRYDTLGPFGDAASWDSVDAGDTDGLVGLPYVAQRVLCDVEQAVGVARVVWIRPRYGGHATGRSSPVASA